MERRFSFIGLFNILIYLFIIAPLIVVIISSFNSGNFLVFPPEGFSLKWYEEVITGGRYMEPFINSVLVALATTAVALPIGVMSAFAILRYDFRLKGFIQSFFLSPLVIPTILVGIGALMIYSTLGFQAHFIKLTMAHIILTVPYVIRMMIAGFSDLNPSVEEASVVLGASPFKTFWLVTLPIVKPAIIASAFITLNLSFDELVMALFLTGPGMNTLPMVIYSDIQYNLTPGVAAISSLIIIATVIIGVAGIMALKKGNMI